MAFWRDAESLKSSSVLRPKKIEIGGIAKHFFSFDLSKQDLVHLKPSSILQLGFTVSRKSGQVKWDLGTLRSLLNDDDVMHENSCSGCKYFLLIGRGSWEARLGGRFGH